MHPSRHDGGSSQGIANGDYRHAPWHVRESFGKRCTTTGEPAATEFGAALRYHELAGTPRQAACSMSLSQGFPGWQRSRLESSFGHALAAAKGSGLPLDELLQRVKETIPDIVSGFKARP